MICPECLRSDGCSCPGGPIITPNNTVECHYDPKDDGTIKPWRHGPTFPDPNCMCGRPLMIVIPAGQHIHPCPVHPDYAVYGYDAVYC